LAACDRGFGRKSDPQFNQWFGTGFGAVAGGKIRYRTFQTLARDSGHTPTDVNAVTLGKPSAKTDNLRRDSVLLKAWHERALFFSRTMTATKDVNLPEIPMRGVAFYWPDWSGKVV